MSHLESPDGLDPRTEVVKKLRQLLNEKFSEETFHNPEHSAEVDVLSYAISAKIREIDPKLVTDQEELGRETAAQGHDAVVDYSDAITGAQAGQRIRRRGFFPMDVDVTYFKKGTGNERSSARKIVELIDEADPHRAIYKDAAINEIYAAVAATYPVAEFKKLPEEQWTDVDPRAKKYFDEEGKGLRIYQPYLTTESSATTLAVALADLSYPGLLGTKESLKKGDAEYRETRDKNGYLIKNGISKIPEEEKASIIADMKKWMNTQVQFYTWRKAETEEIIKNHHFKTTPENQQKIREMFEQSGMSARFNEVITAAINRAEKYATEGFEKLSPTEQLVALAREFGYEV